MSHYSRLSKIVIDVPAADHDSEVAFWSAATGQPLTRIDRFPDYHAGDLHAQDIGLIIQRLGHGAGRMHLDIHTDDPDAEIARLEGLGAQRVQQVQSWWIMRDPAGLLFCVIPEPPGSLTDANAQHWVA